MTIFTRANFKLLFTRHCITLQKKVQLLLI